MPSTTNFGWTTPADTDLVKDGASAIRTLGNGIDTSFVDLKGGTTGQVLAKASNTDLDFSWVTDATGIPATIFDAKGDIIAATAADTAARLAVGTNGQYLSADSTTATGLKWITPAASGFTFQAWTPTWTNLSLGNGTLTARYGTSGKFTHFELYLTLGSTTSVSGVIKFSLPTTPKNSSTYQGQYTNVMMHDNGAQIYFGQGYIDKTNSLLEVYGNYVTGTYLERVGTSATVPFTWTNGDELIVTGNYEEA